MPTTQVYAVARLDALAEPAVVLPAGELDMWAQFPPPHGRTAPYGRFFVEASPANGAPPAELSLYRTLTDFPTQPSSLGAITTEIDAMGPSARLALDERGISAAARYALRSRVGGRRLDGAALFDPVRMG